MLLETENLTKTYRVGASEIPVLKGVSLSLEEGTSLALTGESGSGKSTLLHLIAGLDHADGGTLTVAGTDLETLSDTARAAFRRETVGLVFQQFNLIPSLNVADNIAFQARLAGRHDASWTATLIQRLGLEDLGNRYPEQLSGGQQQRVAIGRTLAARPRLVLADEPTGNLDQSTGDTVFDLMIDLTHETGAGLLVVTHSERLASRLGRRLHLENGALQ